MTKRTREITERIDRDDESTDAMSVLYFFLVIFNPDMIGALCIDSWVIGVVNIDIRLFYRNDFIFAILEKDSFQQLILPETGSLFSGP